MRSTLVVLVMLVTFGGLLVVAPLAPLAAATPPDLPPNHSGCGYFEWDNGNLREGDLPGYEYQHCF